MSAIYLLTEQGYHFSHEQNCKRKGVKTQILNAIIFSGVAMQCSYVFLPLFRACTNECMHTCIHACNAINESSYLICNARFSWFVRSSPCQKKYDDDCSFSCLRFVSPAAAYQGQFARR